MNTPPFVQSPLLTASGGVRHAFFTRRGGVSGGIYESLNVGLGSGDQPEAVMENRRRATMAMISDPSALTTCYQTHSSRVHIAQRSWAAERPEGDGVVTAARGVLCGVLSADCAPVLLADPEAGVVAAAHAGWRGALAGVVDEALDAMRELGAEPRRTVAVIGPCIGPASYEVGLDLMARFTIQDPRFERHFTQGRSPDKRQFDLPGFIMGRLAERGVLTCEWVGLDTCALEDDFFSCRRALKRGDPDYGRLLSVITLD